MKRLSRMADQNEELKRAGLKITLPSCENFDDTSRSKQPAHQC